MQTMYYSLIIIIIILLQIHQTGKVPELMILAESLSKAKSVSLYVRSHFRLISYVLIETTYFLVLYGVP